MKTVYHQTKDAEINSALMSMKSYFVYILSSKTKVLYIGMTDILARRIYEHKFGLVEGFTKNYNVNKLVYYETQPDLESAIRREKQLKNWHRQWKINLIEEKNKEWKDLYLEIADPVKKSLFRFTLNLFQGLW